MVVDEPFYGFYLLKTGKHHPGSTEIISQMETDVYKIFRGLLAPLPEGKSVFYQKQMAHHLLPEIDRSWLAGVTNCFLIRDPADVIVSYIRKNDDPTMDDLGFARQAELFQFVRANSGTTPPVIDARDVLNDPTRILQLLCRAVNVEFDKAMLSWPPGLRHTDGIWAKHWYAEVMRSTSFQPYRPSTEAVPARFRHLCEQSHEYYNELYQHRLH